MKKEYSKPDLDTKAFTQFENVFTACSKGHEGKIWKGNLCLPDTYPEASSGQDLSAGYDTNASV